MAGRIFCSSCDCKYWVDLDGKPHGVCDHPASYGRIDRKMLVICNLYKKKDISEEEVELKEC